MKSESIRIYSVHFGINGGALVATTPVPFEVFTWHRGEGGPEGFIARNIDFDIDTCGSTLEELTEAIKECLRIQWSTYARAQCTEDDPEALIIQRNLQKAFSFVA